MAIWKQSIDLDRINSWNANTLVEHLGMRVTAIGEDHVSGTMPVDARTVQPFGLLHGGASVALAESLGSLGGKSDPRLRQGNGGRSRYQCQPRARGDSGLVVGTARPLHLGRSTQVWEIRILDEDDRLICISRLTMSVVPRRSPKPV